MLPTELADDLLHAVPFAHPLDVSAGGYPELAEVYQHKLDDIDKLEQALGVLREMFTP